MDALRVDDSFILSQTSHSRISLRGLSIAWCKAEIGQERFEPVKRSAFLGDAFSGGIVGSEFGGLIESGLGSGFGLL